MPCLVNCFSMADDMCPFCHKVRLRTSMLRRALSKDPGKRERNVASAAICCVDSHTLNLVQ